jgi:prepilin-type N-terminal cleavage/methylation domain-containing protein
VLSVARSIRVSLRDERGFTLIELLVAIVAGVIVTGAALAILEVSTRQATRISDATQANRAGRGALNVILEELHSSCTGFGTTAIQVPSTTPVSPLAATGSLNLWYLSAYGNPTSAEPAVSKVVEHDINWTATETSNTGEQLGTLRDYAFTGSGSAPNWSFPTLSTANATVKVLATNVVLSTPGTLFSYLRYDTNSANTKTYGTLVPIASGEVGTMATNQKIAQVKIAFSQAPEKGDTTRGHTASFSGAAVLRLTPPEAGSEGSPCA